VSECASVRVYVCVGACMRTWVDVCVRVCILVQRAYVWGRGVCRCAVRVVRVEVPPQSAYVHECGGQMRVRVCLFACVGVACGKWVGGGSGGVLASGCVCEARA
jgi:hypothetical protein